MVLTYQMSLGTPKSWAKFLKDEVKLTRKKIGRGLGPSKSARKIMKRAALRIRSLRCFLCRGWLVVELRDS